MTPDDAGAAFLAGRIDAAVTWEPFLSQGLQNRAGAVKLASSDEYPEAILDIFIAPRAWHQANPGAIALFGRAWDQAIAFLEEQPDSATQLIGREIGVSAAEASGMLAGAKLLRTRECPALLSRPVLDTLAERVERLWRGAGYISGDVDLVGSVLISSGSNQ
jgi:NitT/TauT family transport system substrate-binding protein